MSVWAPLVALHTSRWYWVSVQVWTSISLVTLSVVLTIVSRNSYTFWTFSRRTVSFTKPPEHMSLWAFRWCTTSLFPSCSSFSGQEFPDLWVGFPDHSFSRFDCYEFIFLWGIFEGRSSKCEWVAWQHCQSCRVPHQWNACHYLMRNWISF